jgi:hypothetical protein
VLAVVLIERVPKDADRPADSGFVGTESLGRIVNQLIGAHGLDLRLIDQIPAAGNLNGNGHYIQESSEPSRLSLESIAVPAAVLAWYEPEKCFQRWIAAGLPGVRSRHEDDPHAPTPIGGPSPVYFFNLCRQIDPTQLLLSLQKIERSSKIPVVSLGLGPRASTRPSIVPVPITQAESTRIEANLPIDSIHSGEQKKSAPSDETLQSWANKLDEFDA